MKNMMTRTVIKHDVWCCVVYLQRNGQMVISSCFNLEHETTVITRNKTNMIIIAPTPS